MIIVNLVYEIYLFSAFFRNLHSFGLRLILSTTHVALISTKTLSAEEMFQILELFVYECCLT